jgi:6-phosphogluconolactonase
MTTLNVITTPDKESGAQQAAKLMGALITESQTKRKMCRFALSGGTTAQQPYLELSKFRVLNWTKLVIFWSDERYVETDNPYSNVRTAKESLLDRTSISTSNIFAPFRAGEPPHIAAQKYAQQIRSSFICMPGVLPDFDIIHLGLGTDGHTASLFPGSEALDAPPDQIVASVHAGLAPWVDRITFTPPLINNAHNIIVTAFGESKADVVARVLNSNGDHPVDHSLPITSVRPTNGTVHWIIDEAAASKLDHKEATDA